MYHPDGRPVIRGDGTFLTVEEWEDMLRIIGDIGRAAAAHRYRLVQDIFDEQK